MSTGASIPSIDISQNFSLIENFEKEEPGRCNTSNDSPSGSLVSETSGGSPDQLQQPQQLQSQSQSQPLLKEQPVDQQQRLSSKKPSHAKKLVDKFATFSPMRNKGSDRRLIVETAYSNCNGKKDGFQSDQRSKPAELKSQKKKKRTPINITEGMTKADIFAATVASAIDAADDADEEEVYYTYSTSNSRPPSLNSFNGLHPLSNQSLPHDNSNISQQFQIPPNVYNAFSTPYRTYNTFPHRSHFPNGFYNNNPSASEYKPSNSQSPNPNNNPNNKPNGVMRSSLPDMSQYVKALPNYAPSNYLYSNWYDERYPLFAKTRPQSYETRRRQSCAPTISTLTVIIIFLLASSYLLYYESTCPLSDVIIKDISNVVTADKVLMFDIQVKGRNYGLWDIEIIDTDLSVFATPVRNIPGGIPGGPGSHWDDDVVTFSSFQEAAPSEYLGSIYVFDEALIFPSGINRTGVISTPTGQVRLRNPGGEDKQSQERWSSLLQNQFDLIVRGVLKYTLPFSKSYVATVCFAQRIDGSDGSLDKDGRSRIIGISNLNMILGSCGDWEKDENN
ncbi:hypothetical protein C2G38_2029946 [Gigaspora rosea]|uniref:Vacuolar segregation subunit 7-domain-containing protein n=1 Tax=Gigaspora rosea TaxID=44941 RepID=A0A397VZK2_9GLOM|nr:hypothetical protein C2G38_2029946 [Gigaspora rosea]